MRPDCMAWTVLRPMAAGGASRATRASWAARLERAAAAREAVLVMQVMFRPAMKRLPDVIHLAPEDRIAYFDVLVFCLIVFAYILVMYGLGFWLSSLLMLLLTANYLTLEKARKNVILAMVVPIT